MSNGLSGQSSLAYQGTNAPTPPNIGVYPNAPTVNNYQGFSVGDFWIYRISQTSNNSNLYCLLGKAGNVADWALITGSVGIVELLAGNSGGNVGPNGSKVINVVGDGSTINVVGNPGTNTLTISAIGSAIMESFTTDDSNVVTPTAGNVIVHGGNNITTAGTVGPNTITINVSGTTNHTLQVGNSTGSLTSLGVATNGQLPIGSTGANPVLGTLTAGTGISITNGAGSITIAAAGTDAQSFPTNSGTGTPSAGVLNILGDGNTISTSASGNTVTITSSIPAYSHGTWTPTISFGGASTGVTYGTQIGEYVRIGSLVFINFAIILTNKGSSTGIALINGLPFSNSAAAFHNHTYAAMSNITLDAGYTYIGLSLAAPGGGTSMNIEEYGSGKSYGQLTDTNFTNTSQITASVCYSTGAL